MSDWRLQGQERFLKSVQLVKKHYRKHRNGWDHDHCEFCGAKLSEHPGDLNFGYVSTDDYHWVCENCFNDFREEFQWTVVDPGPENTRLPHR
jgi:hypothetical protein